MKKLFLISILAIVMLTSCSTMYVQVVDIRSAEAGFNPSELYKYTDSNVTIYYNFWAQNGEPKKDKKGKKEKKGGKDK